MCPVNKGAKEASKYTQLQKGACAERYPRNQVADEFRRCHVALHGSDEKSTRMYAKRTYRL
jgi:hypothetical protein